MDKQGDPLRVLAPVVAATVVSLALYSRQALLLFLKIGEVFGGVFDTSVPAYPLAGMLFVLVFLALRRGEFASLLLTDSREIGLRAVGVCVAVAPLAALLAAGPELSASFAFAGLALVCCWVGVLTALKPSVFRFLAPYLLLYLLAVGMIGVLTEYFGDPLAVAVASIGATLTSAFALPVQWSSVYISFTSAGGSPVSLVITQECSGMASMSIFLLVLGLMHLDTRSDAKTSLLFAIGGSALFLLLNALRVFGLILGGLYVGTAFMWNLHGWLGYVLYVVGYVAILLLYTGRLKPPGQKAMQAQLATRPSTKEARACSTRAS